MSAKNQYVLHAVEYKLNRPNCVKVIQHFEF